VSENPTVRRILTNPAPASEPPAVSVRPLRSEDALPAAAPGTSPHAVERRRRRLRQEFAVRVAVTSLILLFNEAVVADHMMSSIIRLTAFIGLVLNVPYYVAIRLGVALRAQAYVRMLVDVALMTVGLYGAGGLGAAQYLGIYTIVPLYAAFVFSSRACMVATLFATASYVVVVALQLAHRLPFTQQPEPDAWLVAAFNLLVVIVVGSLAALLAEAYQVSRQRLAVLYDELEHAHEESLKLNVEIQGAARRFVLAEVVAGVTHDVRNALQGAFGHLWLARRTGRPLSPEAASHLDQAEQACESAMRIVRTTLDMARRPTPEREPVAPAEIVQQTVQLKAVEFRRDAITVETDVADGLPYVLGSRYQLLQVLLNLVGNAQDELRHATGRRQITIAGRTEGGRVVLEVRDTGPGIAPNVLPHVFEPFYTTKVAGTGLGLAISAGIAEAFGGTLTAENRRESGAVFRLTLPAAGRLSPV
jgi:signal transduction histidine kinase